MSEASSSGVQKINRIQEDRALTQKMGKTGHPAEFIWHVHPRATATDLFLEIRQRHAAAESKGLQARVLVLQRTQVFRHMDTEIPSIPSAAGRWDAFVKKMITDLDIQLFPLQTF